MKQNAREKWYFVFYVRYRQIGYDDTCIADVDAVWPITWPNVKFQIMYLLVLQM